MRILTVATTTIDVLSAPTDRPVNAVAEPEGQREVQGARGRLAGRLARAYSSAAQRQDAQDDAEDGELDVVGLPERRAEEARLRRSRRRRGCLRWRIAISVRMPTSEAHAKSSVAHSYSDEVADQRQREGGGEELAERREQGEEQQPEGDHHEPVRHRHDRQPRHPGVAEELAHQRAGCAWRACPGAGGVGLAEPEDGHEVADHLGEERDRDRGDGEAQEERNDLQGWHAREFTEQ